MTTNEIRKKYLNFFKARNHAIIPSASLIPENDSTLLFVNSGMFPLVPYIISGEHPEGKRLADSQKCFRSEDIDEIGDNRHNTFFEMLGNWSLGDYYQEDQLTWLYEFLVEELKIDPSKLYQTVYVGDGKDIKKDTKSINILKNIFNKYNVTAEEGPETIGEGDLGSGQVIDFSKERIFAYRDKNWWQRGDAVGELGGFDSETFYDTGKKHNPAFGEHCHLNCECGKFIEIGNSVFMQYQKTKDGWEELKNKNVDFGGGLERITMAVQDESNIFKTDLFTNIIKKIEELSNKEYFKEEKDIKSFEVIADHIKAATFLIGDGSLPSNTDQGYIVRRLIRRAVRFGRQLEINQETWTSEIAKIVINDYKDIYPNLTNKENEIITALEEEENKFKKTLERGLKEFNKLEKNITGKQAFNLYQTYGFPIEMTAELANDKNITVDQEEFQKHLSKHQELSRTASAGKFKGGLADHSEETTKLHTAAHLLLAALKQVLGEHVSQKGSNITGERLRFDFSHPEKMTDEEKQKVTDIVNSAIQKGLLVTCEEMNIDKAKESGATGVFNSKYGDKVKVYTIGDDNETVSKEICGGPHVENIKDLGVFRIKKETSSSSGIRRIKAILE